jgi:tartrate/fumarate subfamily iron-sulfur-dependent hydro-lyase beta chain
LFRTLDDANPDQRLAAIEEAVLDEANRLTVGPMGFSGKTTLIGCKIGALNRLPASFFVSIAYDCWAFRRLGVTLDAGTGAITSWLYRDGDTPSVPMLTPEQLAAGFPRTGREVRLQAPISDEQVRSLKVGDVVLVSGRMFTGRDQVHHHLMHHEPPVDLRGSVLYHCGPVVAKDGETWRVTAAGPTTSIREEPYQAEILERYGVRVVMGKGGMGPKTLAGLKKSGAVYLNAVGGAAQFYARCIDRVAGVSLMQFGTPRGDVASRRHRFSRDRDDGRTRQQPAQGHRSRERREAGRCPGRRASCDACHARSTKRSRSPQRSQSIVLRFLRALRSHRDRAVTGVGIPPTLRKERPQRRSGIDAAIDMNPDGPAAVRFERLVVADGLRAFQLLERVRRVGHRGRGFVLAGDDERHDGVGAALGVLAGRMQIARPIPNVVALSSAHDGGADVVDGRFHLGERREIRQEGDVVAVADRREGRRGPSARVASA